MMRGYYPVDVRCEDSGLDYRVLFKAVGEASVADLADALKESLRKVLFPDILVIVCIPSEIARIKELLTSDRAVTEALSRASDKVEVVIVELGENGSFGEAAGVRNQQSPLPLLEGASHRLIYDSGLREVFSPDTVISCAPPGFTFLKPSGKRLRFFLKAEDALSDTERVHFVACSILNIISERESRCQPIEIFYIDTMAIGSLAYVLRDLYAEFFADGRRARVVSFHSYAGMADVDIPFPGASFCLISASSSMDLHRKWLDATKCHREEVLTLVTFDSADDADLALCHVPAPQEANEHEPEGSRKDLRIIGESFSADQIPPRTVLLTVSEHGIKGWRNAGPRYSDAQVFDCLRADPGNSKPRALFIHSDRLMEMQVTRNFVDKEIRGKTPISTRLIIYQSDSGSLALAKYCRELLISLVNREIPIIAASNAASADFEDRDAILVVAGVVGRGTQLLSISRDLRALHHGPRHYLVLFQVSTEIRDGSALKKNLTFSSTGEHIEFSLMDSLATGMDAQSSFLNEASLLRSLGPDLPDSLINRIGIVEEHEGLSMGPFLPATTGDDEPLMLRPDFAFWCPEYDAKKNHSAGVFATVAAMLQRARESQVFSSENARLSSDAFQQVVLDPENFARFNDGVIQAALLRAAHPHELNYASIPEASSRMFSILTQILMMHDRKQGEASLEFALALGTKRLRLATIHHQQLIATYSERVDSQTKWGYVISRLLQRSLGGGESERPI